MRKDCIVAKFGGTSVAGMPVLESLAGILSNNEAIRLVVVSAVAGVTQSLLDAYNSNEPVGKSVINQIERLHVDFLHGIQAGVEDCDLVERFYDVVGQLRSYEGVLIESGALLDAWLGLGERLSSILVTLFLKKRGIRVVLEDACEVIKTDDQFGKANPLNDKVRNLAKEKLLPLMEEAVVVTQGYIGKTLNEERTTLGHGGSDYSAAVLAEAIDAKELHLYKDVDGVYTADPRFVEDATRISNLTYEDMASLAQEGFKVLHPATLIPCERAKIPIYIASTFEPHKGGTRIAEAISSKVNIIEEELVGV